MTAVGYTLLTDALICEILIKQKANLTFKDIYVSRSNGTKKRGKNIHIYTLHLLFTPVSGNASFFEAIPSTIEVFHFQKMFFALFISFSRSSAVTLG